MTSISGEGDITSSLTEIVNRKVKCDWDNDNSVLKHSRRRHMDSEDISGKGETRYRKKDSHREKRKKKRDPGRSTEARGETAKDMRIEGSWRRSSVAPVFFWTSVFLLSLTSGIQCISEEQIRHERSATDVQPYSPADLQAINFIREFIQRRQQQQQQSSLTQMTNNGDGLSENMPDFEKVPLPLLLQALLTGFNDDSKEDVKRGSFLNRHAPPVGLTLAPSTFEPDKREVLHKATINGCLSFALDKLLIAGRYVIVSLQDMQHGKEKEWTEIYPKVPEVSIEFSGESSTWPHFRSETGF